MSFCQDWHPLISGFSLDSLSPPHAWWYLWIQTCRVCVLLQLCSLMVVRCACWLSRVLPCVGQLADLPMPAMHSVLLSCIKHEIDAVLLRGMRELLPNQAEALVRNSAGPFGLIFEIWGLQFHKQQWHSCRPHVYRGDRIFVVGFQNQGNLMLLFRSV